MKIISSHYVPCEKPYQVIEYAGYLGMQIGTLVVTEDNPDAEGKYGILSHCHPVVSYSRKKRIDGVNLIQPMLSGGFAECAIWDNVELSETLPVCLIPEGDNEIKISYNIFNSLMEERDMGRIYNFSNASSVEKKLPCYDIPFALAKLGIIVEKPKGVNHISLKMTKEELQDVIPGKAVEYCFVGGSQLISASVAICEPAQMAWEIVQQMNKYLEVLGKDCALEFTTEVPEFVKIAEVLNEKYGGGNKKE